MFLYFFLEKILNITKYITNIYENKDFYNFFISIQQYIKRQTEWQRNNYLNLPFYLNFRKKKTVKWENL
jgi:hypothetical protein